MGSLTDATATDIPSSTATGCDPADAATTADETATAGHGTHSTRNDATAARNDATANSHSVAAHNVASSDFDGWYGWYGND